MFFKKRAPLELPVLPGLNPIENKQIQSNNFSPINPNSNASNQNDFTLPQPSELSQQIKSVSNINILPTPLVNSNPVIQDIKPLALSSQPLQNKVQNTQEIKKLKDYGDDEKGFFKDVISNVTKEVEDLDKLEYWYKSQFLPGDVVFQMREYWEKQSPDVIFKSMSGDLKDRLVERSNKLHQLEKDWQEIYFKLLSKEEEIRKEEKDLKESLQELIEVYKKNINKKDKKTPSKKK